MGADTAKACDGVGAKVAWERHGGMFEVRCPSCAYTFSIGGQVAPPFQFSIPPHQVK